MNKNMFEEFEALEQWQDFSLPPLMDDDEPTLWWEYIGESLLGGDYDPNDPLDSPVLRFSVLDKDGEQLPNASYATRLSPATPHELLVKFGERVLGIVEAGSYKSELEYMTWLTQNDLEKGVE